MSEQRISRYDYGLLLLITAVLNYFWIRNVQYYALSGTIVPTFINYFKDNSLYSNSLIIAGFDHCLTYYYYIAAVLSKLFSVSAVISILSLIPGVVVVPLTFALGLAISENKYAGYLSIFAMHSHWLSDVALGGSEGVGDNIAHVSFATVFLMLAWLFYLKKRTTLAYAIAGLMFNIHAPLALAVMFVIFVCEYFNRELLFKKIAIHGLLTIIFAAPTLYWYCRILLSEPAAAGNLAGWSVLNRVRNVHSLPFSWNLGQYIRFAACAFNLLLLPKLFVKELRIYKVMLSTVIAVVILCLIGTFFVEICNVPLITKLSLFRSTRFLVYLSAVILSAYLVQMAVDKRIFTAKAVLAGIIIVSFVTYNIKVAILAELFLFYMLDSKKGTNLNRVAVIIMALLGITGFFLVPQKYIFPFIDNMPAFIVTLIISFAAMFLYKYKIMAGRPVFYSSIALVLASFAYLRFFDLYSQNEVFYLNNVEETQEWLANNTPKGAMILTPPDIESWENYSKRTVFITFGQIATGFYNADLVPEILRRISLYGSETMTYKTPNDFCENMLQRFQKMDGSTLKKYAEEGKYNLKYVVADNRSSFDLPVIFSNVFFKVYAIN